MLIRLAHRSASLRAPALIRPSLARAAPASLVRYAHETPMVDFRDPKFQASARDFDQATQQLQAQQQKVYQEAMMAIINETFDESIAPVANMSDKEIEIENARLLKEHCARYHEPPVEYILVHYEEVFAQEHEGLEEEPEDSMPAPGFDQELLQGIADEPYPEPVESILTNSAWMEHRKTNITNEADLKALLDQAKTKLRSPKLSSKLRRQERGFYEWLGIIAEASEERWKGCFETITVQHAPEHLKRHFSREGLEYVYQHPVRREMALSLAERYSSWAVAEDEHVHRFSTWPKVSF